MSPVLVLASFGRSLGIRRIYVQALLNIFQVSTIEKLQPIPNDVYRHWFDADPDPDPNFNFDTNPDSASKQRRFTGGSFSKFETCWKIRKNFNFSSKQRHFAMSYGLSHQWQRSL
jgi:hypothetical protein